MHVYTASKSTWFEISDWLECWEDAWLDPGEPFFEFVLTFVADPGIELIRFAQRSPLSAGDEVLANLVAGDAGSLAILGGDPALLRSASEFLGPP